MLSVLSFNVLAQAWIDDRLRREAHDSRHLSRSYRVKRQIELLKQHPQPDIVLLQEVTPLVLNHYKEALPDYHVPSCFSRMKWQPATPKDPINGNAIIWRRGLFAGKAKCDVVCLDERKGNYAAMVTGVLASTGQHIRVVSLHLEWGDTNSASKQFNNLFDRGYITNHKRVIIGGDFNMCVIPILDDIKRHVLTDSVKIRTHPFPDPTECKTVTHVLSRGMVPKGCKLLAGDCESVGDCLKKYGSDHYAVFCKFQLL